jgi:acetyl esterase/lipase
MEHEVLLDLEYGRSDGSRLTGDLYVPKAPGKYPALVAVHGGGWQVGDKDFYRHWGPYLAQRGYVLFAVNYRLMREGRKMYPEAMNDVRAAVQFVRERGETMKADPQRVGLVGDSAGAHLGSLVALAGDTRVKVFVGVYGVYDLAAQWEQDLIRRPLDNITQKFLGASLVQNRQLYFEASPLSYATMDRNQTACLLACGTEDDIVDRNSQTDVFMRALKQAGFFVRPVIVPGAPHFWMSDPLDEPGSFSAILAPQLARFLQQRL